MWPHPSPYEASKVAPRLRADSPAALPPLSPLPISPLFFSHNKSGPDFPKQTALWGPSPPITLCQFQSGLKYDSTVCASRLSPLLPPPNLHVIPTIASSSLNDPLTTVTVRSGDWTRERRTCTERSSLSHSPAMENMRKNFAPLPVPPKTQTGDSGRS